MNWLARTVLAAACATTTAADAFGQTPHVIRLGPISAGVTVRLSSLGFDTNVFNAVQPRRDTTFNYGTTFEARGRIGRGNLLSVTTPSIGYFRRYGEQRSRNFDQTLGYDLSFNRVAFRASLDWLNAKERPAPDIDSRVRRIVTTYGAGADLRISAKTTVRGEVSQAATAFRDGETVGRVDLATALNRTNRSAGLSLRFARSALTTMTMGVEWLEDRFDRTPDRNATGFRVMPGVEFSKSALVSGTVSVGYRVFTPSNPAVPTYRGLASRIDVASVIRGRVRVAGSVDRDVTYSYDVARPYYLQTGFGVSVTQRIGEKWDVLAATGVQRLAYRSLVTAGRPEAEQTVAPEQGNARTFSVGYRIVPALRMGIDARHTSRLAPTTGNYDGWQVGGSFTYVF